MRIAVAIPSFLPDVGGAEFVAHHLAVQWGKQGHEVCVVNWRADEVTHPEATYQVRRFRLLRGAPRIGYHRLPFSWYTVSDLNRLLADFAPDFISGHMGYPMGVYLDRLWPRRPYVVTCHGRDLTSFSWGYRVEYPIDRVLLDALSHSQGAIAISSFAHRLMSELGVPEQTIKDIPNGVDLDRFAKRVSFDLRTCFELPEDAIIVLSVGREHPQKAFATGIRAFAELVTAESRSQRPIHYVVLGRGTSVNQALVNELGVSDRVHLCDGLHGDDLVGAYQQADVYFSPSIWEMMPLVVLESMAAHLPAVVTNVSGSQDLILDGETGHIVEAEDVPAMADALGCLVDSETRRRRFSEATRERVQDYSWDRISRLYLELA